MKKPSGRVLLAASILTTWGVALSLQARRTALVPAAERLAAAARELPPGDAWYGVFQGAERTGWARRQLDTIPGGGGFILRERSARRIPGFGSGTEYETNLVAWLDAGVRLDSLRYAGTGPGDTVALRAVVESDSVLVVRPGRRIVVRSRPLLPAAWPLRFAAAVQARSPGRKFSLVLFDPATAAAHDLTLHVEESAMLTWPDSADAPDGSTNWRAVRLDTVQAWRILRREGSRVLTAWVDEDGRVVRAEFPGGLRYERMAFELAFFEPSAPGEVAAGENHR